MKTSYFTNSSIVTQQLREILSDGEYHSKKELYEAVSCDNIPAFKYQLIVYRRQLPEDERLICELTRRTIGYRQVKHLTSNHS